MSARRVQHPGQGLLFADRGRHASHRVHANSGRSWRELDLSGRKLEVCQALARLGSASTDRQVCRHLGRADMNYARPAITHLIQDRILAEVDEVVDEATGRRVRRVWFAAERSEP